MRNESERDRILRLGRQSLQMLDKDQNWTWWLDVGEALITLRHEAMDEAVTNKPEGGAYNRIFGKKLRDEQLEFDKGDRKRLFDVMDHKADIERWRAGLEVHERRRLNHPSTVWRKWKASTTVPEPKEESPSPVAKLRDVNLELTQELDALQAHIRELEASRETDQESASESVTLGFGGHLMAVIEEAKRRARLAGVWDGDLETFAALPHKEIAELATKLDTLAKDVAKAARAAKAVAKAKPAKEPTDSAADSGKLVWTETRKSGVKGHKDYEAKAGPQGVYTIAPIENARGFAGAYGVSYARNPGAMDAGHTSLRNAPTADKAKALAQKDWDARRAV